MNSITYKLHYINFLQKQLLFTQFLSNVWNQTVISTLLLQSISRIVFM